MSECLKSGGRRAGNVSRSRVDNNLSINGCGL